jgi:hypothetical protein
MEPMLNLWHMHHPDCHLFNMLAYFKLVDTQNISKINSWSLSQTIHSNNIHISFFFFIFMGPCIVRCRGGIYDQQDATNSQYLLPVNNSTTHPKLIHRFTWTSEPRATTQRDYTTTVTPWLEYSWLKREPHNL